MELLHIFHPELITSRVALPKNPLKYFSNQVKLWMSTKCSNLQNCSTKMKHPKNSVWKDHLLLNFQNFARLKDKKYQKTIFPNIHLDLLASKSDFKMIAEKTNKFLLTSLILKFINNFPSLLIQEGPPTAAINKISIFSAQNHTSHTKKPSTTVNCSNQ